MDIAVGVSLIAVLVLIANLALLSMIQANTRRAADAAERLAPPPKPTTPAPGTPDPTMIG